MHLQLGTAHDPFACVRLVSLKLDINAFLIDHQQLIIK